MNSEPIKSAVIIRHAQVADAQKLIVLRTKLYAQSKNMLLEDGEYSPSLGSEQAFISEFSQSKNSAVLLAVKDGVLVGFMGVVGGRARRIEHCADVFLGVDKSVWGQGIGWQLMQFLNTWALGTCLRRLALTTAVANA